MDMDFNNFDIKKLILTTIPPYEFLNNKDIQRLSYNTCGSIVERFEWIQEEIDKTDELLLWKIFGEIQNYWANYYEKKNNKNYEYNHKTSFIVIKQNDVGKCLKTVINDRFTNPNWTHDELK